MTEQNRPAFDAALWLQWIVATALGWLLGSLLFPNLPAISAGVGVGLLQWPILVRRIPQAWHWALSTALAWLGASILLVVTIPPGLHPWLSGLFVGPAVGLAQWLILRRVVRWPGWWIVISTIAWISGLTLLPGTLSTGAMVGAISGIALSLLLYTPRPSQAPDQENQEEATTWKTSHSSR